VALASVVRDATSDIEDFCRARGLAVPPGVASLHGSDVPEEVAALLYRPGLPPHEPPSLDWACATADASAWPLPANLIPVLPVDDASFACVVASAIESDPVPGEGAVVRWHLGITDPLRQAALLDTDVTVYVASVAAELAARPEGVRRVLDEIGPAYGAEYLAEDRKPRDFIVRPVRIACQNVIIGLAAIAQDSSFDGLSVVAWQTCEVPHVAAHEGNRALAALTLCDAYQNGGTMEVRFDRPARIEGRRRNDAGDVVEFRASYAGHPEGRVPASLRRYGRTVGIELGASDPASISPDEARQLFLAVTPMPPDLRVRVLDAVSRGTTSPERLCFTLLAQVWREIELDFMLACSDRVGSILSGGADWRVRSARAAEMEVARSALIAGMFFRRLDTKDTAAADGEARVLEDNRVGVTWSILDEVGAIRFQGLRTERMPWLDGGAELQAEQQFVVLPRSLPSVELFDTARSLAANDRVAVALPADVAVDETLTDAVTVLRCPDRIAELDQAVEARLLTSRIARA
jgi:hypothetical protein